jgi:hypothetical protein
MVELKSTYEIYREVVADAPHDRQRHEEAEFTVDTYLQETEVLLENRGEEPFEGYRATYAGREYRVEPGRRRLVPLAAAIHFLGNWASVGERRRMEHEALKIRYGYFESISPHDIEMFINKSQALSQALSLKSLPKAVRSSLQKAAERLPQPAELPKLAVLDPDTEQELQCKWPLYDPEWEPEPDAIPADLKPIYDALVEKLRQERAEAEKEFVRRFEEEVGSVDDLELEEEDQ